MLRVDIKYIFADKLYFIVRKRLKFIVIIMCYVIICRRSQLEINVILWNINISIA